MYKIPLKNKKGINLNQSIEGESIELQVSRAMRNKQKLEGQTPLMYTERRQGVMPSTNVRTDRFEIAIDATEKIAKSYKARREEKPTMKLVKDSEAESIPEPKPIKLVGDTK
jgi:hypothetical protein